MAAVAACPYLAEADVEVMGNLRAADPDDLLARIQREDPDQEVGDSAEPALANLGDRRDAASL